MTKSTGVRDAFRTPTKSPKSAERGPAQARTPAAEQQHDQAVKALRMYLGDRYASGLMHATDVCELAWLLVQVGVPLEDLAVNPGLESWNTLCSRKLRKAYNLDQIEGQLLTASVPLVEVGKRYIGDHPLRCLPHVLRDLFLEHPDTHIAFAAELKSAAWINHPVRQDCQRCGDLCIPYGLFTDAAAWRGKGAGSRDSIINYMVNLLGDHDSSRHAITTIRKDSLCGLESCKCPCRGRCSLDTLEQAICWMGAWAADGLNPSEAPVCILVSVSLFILKIWQDLAGHAWAPAAGVIPGQPVLAAASQTIVSFVWQ